MKSLTGLPTQLTNTPLDYPPLDTVPLFHLNLHWPLEQATLNYH